MQLPEDVEVELESKPGSDSALSAEKQFEEASVVEDDVAQTELPATESETKTRPSVEDFATGGSADKHPEEEDCVEVNGQLDEDESGPIVATESIEGELVVESLPLHSEVTSETELELETTAATLIKPDTISVEDSVELEDTMQPADDTIAVGTELESEASAAAATGDKLHKEQHSDEIDTEIAVASVILEPEQSSPPQTEQVSGGPELDQVSEDSDKLDEASDDLKEPSVVENMEPRPAFDEAKEEAVEDEDEAAIEPLEKGITIVEVETAAVSVFLDDTKEDAAEDDEVATERLKKDSIIEDEETVESFLEDAKKNGVEDETVSVTEPLKEGTTAVDVETAVGLETAESQLVFEDTKEDVAEDEVATEDEVVTEPLMDATTTMDEEHTVADVESSVSEAQLETEGVAEVHLEAAHIALALEQSVDVSSSVEQESLGKVTDTVELEDAEFLAEDIVKSASLAKRHTVEPLSEDAPLSLDTPFIEKHMTFIEDDAIEVKVKEEEVAEAVDEDSKMQSPIPIPATVIAVESDTVDVEHTTDAQMQSLALKLEKSLKVAVESDAIVAKTREMNEDLRMENEKLQASVEAKAQAMELLKEETFELKAAMAAEIGSRDERIGQLEAAETVLKTQTAELKAAMESEIEARDKRVAELEAAAAERDTADKLALETTEMARVKEVAFLFDTSLKKGETNCDYYFVSADFKTMTKKSGDYFWSQILMKPAMSERGTYEMEFKVKVKKGHIEIGLTDDCTKALTAGCAFWSDGVVYTNGTLVAKSPSFGGWKKGSVIKVTANLNSGAVRIVSPNGSFTIDWKPRTFPVWFGMFTQEAATTVSIK